MDSLTNKEIEEQVINRYFDGIIHGRCYGIEEKKNDWAECKILLEDLKKRGVQLDEFLTKIYERVSQDRPKGRMETLFVLTKKFGNRRIVRNVSEYLSGNRTIWLKKYRFALKNGHNCNLMICDKCGNRMYYCEILFCSRNACQYEYEEVHEHVNKVVILQNGIYRPQLNSTYFQIYYKYSDVKRWSCSMPNRIEIRRISERNRMTFFRNPQGSKKARMISLCEPFCAHKIIVQDMKKTSCNKCGKKIIIKKDKQNICAKCK